MEFLLNPNVAYLLLVGGVLLGILAIVQPGTGLLELLTAFCLLLAAYAIYNLSFQWWALIILVLAVIPLIFALRNFQRTVMLGLTIVLVIVGSVFIFPGAGGSLIGVNPVLALVVSLIAGGFLWLVLNKMIEAMQGRAVLDLSNLVGQQGQARTDVQNEGSVQVAGELWSARSEKPIAAGRPVRVVGRDGFTLIVEGVES